MSTKKGPSGGYDVGYGKPPKSGQFKPGQSGNPTGKQRGRGLAQYIAEFGEMERSFVQGGTTVSKTANAALAEKLFSDALKGKSQAAKLLLDAQKNISGDLSTGRALLAGPEEMEVARTHMDWLNLIEDAERDAENDDAASSQ